MFPTGRPPYPPMGMFPRAQQPAASQGVMKFVSPFLNKGAQASAGYGPQGFGPQGFGGAGFGPQMASAAGNAGGAGWLGRLQTALKAMQSAAPIVQQYGPMVKNIPAMINMMKLMNESDEEETETKEEEIESETILDDESDETGSSPSQTALQGTSQPKLYI